jgi:hypothetical protein
MQEIWIAHNAWILVGDGRKALMLRNEGTPSVSLPADMAFSAT